MTSTTTTRIILPSGRGIDAAAIVTWNAAPRPWQQPGEEVLRVGFAANRGDNELVARKFRDADARALGAYLGALATPLAAPAGPVAWVDPAQADTAAIAAALDAGDLAEAQRLMIGAAAPAQSAAQSAPAVASAKRADGTELVTLPSGRGVNLALTTGWCGFLNDEGQPRLDLTVAAAGRGGRALRRRYRGDDATALGAYLAATATAIFAPPIPQATGAAIPTAQAQAVAQALADGATAAGLPPTPATVDAFADIAQAALDARG